MVFYALLRIGFLGSPLNFHFWMILEAAQVHIFQNLFWECKVGGSNQQSSLLPTMMKRSSRTSGQLHLPGILPPNHP